MEVLGPWGSILLKVSLVVVEGAVFASRLQKRGVLDHLGVEMVQILNRDGVLHHDDTILGQSVHRDLQVLLAQTLVLDLLGGGGDGRRLSGCESYSHF